MGTHREALEKILKICYESSLYNRRVQRIHEEAMVALGLTESQRKERHVKAAMRAELHKENTRNKGAGHADREHKRLCEEDTGEERMKCRRQFVS